MKKTNIEEFCNLIEFSQKQYYDIVNICKHNKGYYSFKIPKKSGGERIIYSPNNSLKLLQTKIKNYFKSYYKPLSCCHGFVEKKSCITNAEKHINKKWCLNFDLEDFFPSINFGRIWGLFKSKFLNFDNSLSTTLAIICCHEKKLPQGAPTSPILANMICLSLDKKLIDISKNNKCVYTRYADDITFSTNLNKFPQNIANFSFQESYVELSQEVNKIVKDAGFLINSSKTRLQGKTKCQMVTGIVVNKKLNLKRKYYRNLRAILFNCQKEGLGKTALKNNLSSELELKKFLLGKLSYYKSIVSSEHSSYNILCKMYNKYIEPKFMNCYYNIDELCKNALYVIENKEIMCQGTAFLIYPNKLYTCKHCLINLNNNFTADEMLVELKLLENKIDVFNYSNPDQKYKIKNIKLFDSDVAFMELDSLHNEICFQSKSVNLNTGDKCKLIGFPNYAEGATPNIQDSIITSQRKHFGFTYYTINSFIISGSSGGPILNSEFEVIGIATNGGASLEEASTTNANMFYSFNDLKIDD